MSEIVPGWVHNPGRHCGSTALSDLMHFNGRPFSEALCFGLGAGLGFYYINLDGFSPSRMVSTRSAGLEPNFFNFIGTPFSWKMVDDSDSAFEIMRKQIRSGVPMLLQCDLKYLHYYKTQTSFSGHVIVLWGFDDAARMCYVADTQFPGLQEVPYDSMIKARTSQAFPMPVSNNWFPGRIEGIKGAMPDLVRHALRANAHEMLEGSAFVTHRGIPAMRALADDLPNWGAQTDWKWCARFTYQVIEKRGTGGGGFRLIYADFLREAAEHVQEVSTLGWPAKMKAIGDEWTAISSLLKEESENDKPERLVEISKRVSVQADMEQSFFESVLQHIR